MEVFDAAVAGKSPRKDVQEARNYISALRHDLNPMDEGFRISSRLIREMHKLLLVLLLQY